MEYENAGQFDESEFGYEQTGLIGDGSLQTDVIPSYNFLCAGVDSEQYGYGEPEIYEDGNPCVDTYFEADAAKLITGLQVPNGHIARLRNFTKVDYKKAVIERDMDNLTSEEMTRHSEEVSTAIHEEFRIWMEHKYFERRPRKGAKNILVRWVCTWKRVESKTDPSKLIRIIRMRLTQRGFKDIEKGNFMTFSGTATRLAQKLIVSEAYCHRHQGWRLPTVDAKNAFLKGIT